MSALRGALTRHAHLFDAVEWNGMFTRTVNFNVFAERWAQRHGKPIVGNGDVHRLEQLGTTYSLVDADPHPPRSVTPSPPDVCASSRRRIRRSPQRV